MRIPNKLSLIDGPRASNIIAAEATNMSHQPIAGFIRPLQTLTNVDDTVLQVSVPRRRRLD